MRRVGNLPTADDARAISDFLLTRGIENNAETEDDGAFSIWVHDDDQLAEATEHLARYRSSPDKPEFREANARAATIRREAEKAERRRRSTVIDEARTGYERNFSGFAWLPAIFAALCVAVTLWAGELGLMPSSAPAPSGVGEREEKDRSESVFERRNRIAMTQLRVPEKAEELAALTAELQRSQGEFTSAVRRHYYDISLPEVRHGEVWRLFASIFLHFGIIHLVFNLMWLRDLGGFIQNRFGARHLAVLVLLSAAVSNYAQLLWTGPGGGGFSGVNYALFGYLWMRGKFDRGSAWQLSPQIVQTMMVWFFLCFTPLIPNVANGAHGAGLLFGMAAGFLIAKSATRRRES